MQTILSKIIVAFSFGVAFIIFSYFDLLRKVPGFYCEGFGCLGLGLLYLVIGAVLIPLTVVIIGFATTKEHRGKHALESFVISALIMFFSFSVLELLNNVRIASDTQAGIEAEKQFNEITARNEATEKNEEKPLSIEGVDTNRNNSGRGVFQAKMIPSEMFTDTLTAVTVSAEIGSVRDVESVKLYSISDTVAKPVYMHDDGIHGDIKAHDTIFTTEEEIIISSPREIQYEIEVIYTDGYKANSTQELKLQIYKPLPENASVDASTFATQVEENYFTYRSTMNATTARTKILTEVQNNPNVSFADLADEDLSIVYKGVRVWVKLYGPMDGPPIN